MFAAFLGPAEFALEWRRSVERHAAWLNQTLHLKLLALVDGSQALFAWTLPPGAPEPVVETSGGAWRLTTTAHAGSAAMGPDQNLTLVETQAPSGQTTVTLPLGTPEAFFFACDTHGWCLSTDLRFVTRWTGAGLDEHGLYALFQYGLIPAPFTLARGVRRIPNGHSIQVQPRSCKVVLRRTVRLGAAGETAPLPSEVGPDPDARVAAVLDDLLVRAAPAALFFSGGVDSSLLAARLRDLGFSETRLINFSFGPQDVEGQHAQRVADHLGLAFEQIIFQPADVVPMLQRIGRDYSFPFVDRSVIPTNLLVHAAANQIGGNRVIVEGTGADGAFGAWNTYSRVAHLPKPLRWALASGYDWLSLWQRPSKMERVARLARGTWQMPAAHAQVLAQNVLDQVAYAMPPRTRRRLEAALGQHAEAFGAGLELEQQRSLLDLICICAGIFAVKSFDPLTAAGVRPIYPFIEPPMLRLSASLRYCDKSSAGQPKAVLRRLLGRHLPNTLIERPKSGFLPSMPALLAQPAVQAYLQDEVLQPANPVLAFCQPAVLQAMLARAAAQRPLADGAYRFLWAVIFASCWLRQTEN